MRLDQLEEQAHLLNQPRNQPGTVVVLTGETSRYTQFWLNLLEVGFQIPRGSTVRAMVGNDIAESRNQAVEEMVGEWVWFIDDDHSFRGDIVQRLLDREVDVVAPICYRRQSPFLPTATVDDDFLDVSLYGEDALVEVQQTGSSGMLIRKKVFAALEPPWFEMGHDGRLPVSEDIVFCRRCREAGFPIHVDMAVRLGHITTATVWPTWSEEMQRWMCGFTVADGSSLLIDAVTPDEYAEQVAAAPAEA